MIIRFFMASLFAFVFCLCVCETFSFGLEDSEKEEGASPLRTVVAANVAMAVDRTVFYPVDFAITQRQYSSKPFLNIFRETFRSEGLRGFFRGYGPQLLSSFPISFVFAANARAYESLNGSEWYRELGSGLLSATLFSAIYNPFDIRRTWLVTHKKTFQPVYFASNYIGLPPQFIRAFLYSLSISGTRYIASQDNRLFANLNESTRYFAAGFVPGIMAQIAMSPVDVVKTRVMADQQGRGALYHSGAALKERALLNGAFARIIRHGPATGLIMGIMSMVSEAMK